MVHTTKVIHVEPGSELDRALDEAGETPIELEKDGARYRLDRVNATESIDRPSAAQVALSIEGIRKAAGSWSDIDAEAFKAYIRERRKTANRPSVRW
jgi:hypothetical protein